MLVIGPASYLTHSSSLINHSITSFPFLKLWSYLVMTKTKTFELMKGLFVLLKFLPRENPEAHGRTPVSCCLCPIPNHSTTLTEALPTQCWVLFSLFALSNHFTFVCSFNPFSSPLLYSLYI